MFFTCRETMIFFLGLLISILYFCPFKPTFALVDYTYCRKTDPAPIDKAGYVDERDRPLLFMGATWDKALWIVTSDWSKTSFSESAFKTCAIFNMTLARIVTACEYGIVEKWFFDKYPTNYGCWIAGMRFGKYFRPIWVTTGEPIDMSQYGRDVNNGQNVAGPYYPGGYDPLAYPLINCLTVSRNCPMYTSGPTNPCEQTPTNPPELQFMWNDCRGPSYRPICEETLSPYKEGNGEGDEEKLLEPAT